MYEGENGAGECGNGDPNQPITQKYINSKLAKKRAEEDSKLLANRIKLLKMEEQKAWKKIEETKKKARDIM